MAKFDLDDPLGDLLSEGSDDSFYDDPKPQTKRASITKSPDKKSVSSISKTEDIRDDGKSLHENDDWLGLNSNKATPSPKQRQKPVKKISFEEDQVDILNTLDLDSKNKSELKMEVKKGKPSLMESILGPPKEDNKKQLSFDDLLKESRGMNKQNVAHGTKSFLELTEDKRSSSAVIPSSETRERRRGRARTPIMSNPLGLFDMASETEVKPQPGDNAPQLEEQKEPITEVIYASQQGKEDEIKKKGNLEVPAWLGAGQSQMVASSEKTGPSSAPVANTESEMTIPLTMSLENLVTQQKLATSHIEYQNSSIALQQQESQLLMALQLKKYEESMVDMQHKQQEVLIKQEQQFNSLLDRQFAKQQVIENNMRLQQERINNHIQMLISQPSVSPSANTDELERMDEMKKANVDEVINHYDMVIVNLKARHQEELAMLEESYKKQVSTLEQSMESVEKYLNMEIEFLGQKQHDKLEALKTEHHQEIDKYQKKIEELHALHDNEIKQMRENNDHVLKELKYEYNTIIENLKSSKNMEQAVLQDAHSYSAKLNDSLKLLDINSRSLSELREHVHNGYSVFSQAREEQLKAKQQEIDEMRLALEKARESTDQERAQLMSLVRNLEIKLCEQNQNSREERLALQHAAATLAARAAALDREADYNRQSLDREREQLNILRETILAEQQKSMQELTDERLKLHTEKVRIETASKLSQNYDAQKGKAEVDAAIQVAKEAAAMTDKERENLLKEIREVETLKRTLLDRESRLSSRERDLDVALEHANRKSMLGEKALEDARLLQMNYNDKLREIQAQMNSINLRERKLAEDKIAISKERLALHSNARQLRKCGLCVVENQPGFNEDDISEHVEQDIPRFTRVSDADMFRLQLQMSEEYLTTSHGDE